MLQPPLSVCPSRCSFAGGPFTQECDDFVDTYAPATFDFLEVRVWEVWARAT